MVYYLNYNNILDHENSIFVDKNWVKPPINEYVLREAEVPQPLRPPLNLSL